jgi:hypothetical protein
MSEKVRDCIDADSRGGLLGKVVRAETIEHSVAVLYVVQQQLLDLGSQGRIMRAVHVKPRVAIDDRLIQRLMKQPLKLAAVGLVIRRLDHRSPLTSAEGVCEAGPQQTAIDGEPSARNSP